MFDSEDEKQEYLKKISKLWKKTLEERGLTEDIYNKLCVEKFENKKSRSVLKKATTKKELDLLLEARAIVDKSIENVSEKESKFELDKDAYDFFTLEVFENLKPELEEKGIVEVEDIHRGNYFSRDVYRMIVNTPPFYLASHEFYRMNIQDHYDNYYPHDRYEYHFNPPKTLKGFKLIDIINKKFK